MRNPNRWHMAAHVAPACLAGLLAVATALVCGCAAVPATTATSQERLTGALLSVRLVERLDPPAAIQIDVASPRDGNATSVTARRQHSVPGRYADYLVALALAPQSYLLTAVRDAAPPGEDAPAALATFALPFDVTAGGPSYLGRLVVSAGGSGAAARIQVEDQYDDDAVAFRSAVGALRSVTIGHAVLADRVIVAPPAAAAAPVLPERRLTVGTVADDVNADAAFTQSARSAFTRFLRSKPPRAFAIGSSNARVYALASGNGAVTRAMRDCARQAGGTACRLFAVDDTILPSPARAAAP